MIKSLQIRLYPTKEQEKLMWESSHIARFAYNWGLNRLNEYYEENKKGLSVGNLRKEFTILRNDKNYEWLKNVSSEIPQQALKDLGEALDKFFKKTGSYPKFKKRGRCSISFYQNTGKIVVKDKTVRLEKIGFVKMKDEGRLSVGNYKTDKIKVTNPRVKHNGRYWYLSLGTETKNSEHPKLTGETIGIDVGIKDLAIVSNIDKPFKNINKTKKIKQLKKRLKRLQRQVSRKYLKNKEGNKFVKTKNIKKHERKLKLVYMKISNIRNNHLHQTTNAIVKTKPSKIVVEDLNIRGMMKNKHLSRAVGEQSLNTFMTFLNYKSEFNGIEFVKANRFFPSSKKCSCCGEIKKDLKLSDRTYKCDKCGFIIDRDKNASINLANYQSA